MLVRVVCSLFPRHLLHRPNGSQQGISNFVLLLLETTAKPQSPFYAIAVVKKHINDVCGGASFSISYETLTDMMDAHTSSVQVCPLLYML
jgi:hypothetical protein